MSVRVMAQIWESGPSEAADLLMLLALGDHADDGGVCWPTVERLAYKCRIQRRGAQKVIARLERDGWLSRSGKGGIREDGHGVPNRYQINLDLLRVRASAGPPQEEEKGVLDDNKGVLGGTEGASPRTHKPSVNHQEVQPSSLSETSTRVPRAIEETWRPSRETAALVKRDYPNLRHNEEWKKFVNHYIATGMKKNNWDAQFRIWCSNAQSQRDDRDDGATDDLGFPLKSRAAWSKHMSGSSVTEED